MVFIPAGLYRGGGIIITVMALLLTPNVAVWADDGLELLDESEYRNKLEEVVVTGQQPDWRKSPAEQQEWRPEAFTLPQQTRPPRIEWFPAFARDERDYYQGVRDRTGEKAEIQIFKWLF